MYGNDLYPDLQIPEILLVKQLEYDLKTLEKSLMLLGYKRDEPNNYGRCTLNKNVSCKWVGSDKY